jgi:hypothetical protein
MPTGIKGIVYATCHPDRKLRAKGLCGRCYSKEYRKSNKDNRDRREWYIENRYGITKVEYIDRREQQRISGDLCGVCKEPLVENPTPNLDHNHKTGQLREFLHAGCNMALGLLKDSPEVCRLAAEYLEKHQEIANVQE